MPVEITIEDDIVAFTVPEEWPRDDALRTQADVARLLHERGLRRVLVDCRRMRASRFKTADTFEVTSGHLTAFPPGTRHAVVVDAADRHAALVEFAEVVAGNRGVVLGTFDDLVRAREWLRDPHEPSPRSGRGPDPHRGAP